MDLMGIEPMALARQANGLPLTYRSSWICAVSSKSAVHAYDFALVVNHFTSADVAYFH